MHLHTLQNYFYYCESLTKRNNCNFFTRFFKCVTNQNSWNSGYVYVYYSVEIFGKAWKLSRLGLVFQWDIARDYINNSGKSKNILKEHKEEIFGI